MKLLRRRKPNLHEDLLYLQEQVRRMEIQLEEIRLEQRRHAAYLGSIQAVVEQTGRYLAEQEWQQNADQAISRYKVDQLGELTETEEERLDRLRHKWEKQMKDRKDRLP